MKKALSLILVLALAVSMLCTAAFAEGSKTNVFGPTGSGSKTNVFGPTGSGSKTNVFGVTGSGSKTNVFGTTGSGSKTELFDSFEVEFTESESKLDAITTEEMAEAIAAAVAEAAANGETVDVDINAEDLVLVSQCDFTAAEYPVFVTFYGEGTEEVMVCQFVKYENADAWTLAYAGFGGEWSAEFEAAGTYAIAVIAG